MLYHGSKIAGIKTLKPFPHNAVDGESVVFATYDIRFALAMIHGNGDELAIGYFEDLKTKEKQMYIDELIPNAFQLLEKPGVIYTLDDTGFAHDNRLCQEELISKTETNIISEKYIDNIFTELQKFDINFVKYDKVLEEMNNRGKDPKYADILHKENRFD